MANLGRIGRALLGGGLGGVAGLAAGAVLGGGDKKPKQPGAQEMYGNEMRGEGALAAQYGAQADASRNHFMNILQGTASPGGQQAATTAAQGTWNSMLPQLRQALQGQQESNIRRGVQNGSYATSTENDIWAQGFNQLGNSIAQQAVNLRGQDMSGAQSLYGMDTGRQENSRNRYLSLLEGNVSMDRYDAEQGKKRKGGIGGLIGGALGGVLGSVFPVVGTAVGGAAGSAIGRAIGGKGY